MLRSELVRVLAEKNTHLYEQDVERIVSTVLGEITNTLKAGGRVELRAFGSFTVKLRKPRLGRNPRNGNKVEVSAKLAPAFKCSKNLHQRLNEPGA